MARPLRILFPGAHYHIMNHGEMGSSIFLDDGDRKTFLSLLAAAAEMFRAKIYAFSLMETHYHLLIQTLDANLSGLMRHLGSVYTQKFNRKHQSYGHVFRGRYKAILVDRDEYLLEIIRYIHLNPVRAGIVEAPELHKWTSHNLYIASRGGREPICSREILLLFDKSIQKARHEFHDFIQQGVPENVEKFYSRDRLPAILGSTKYIEEIRERFVYKFQGDYELPEAKRISKIPIKQIAELIAAEHGLHVTDIKEGKRKVLNQPRRLAIHIARRYGGYPLREIGEFFHIRSYTGVSTIVAQVQREIDTNKKEKAKLMSLLGKLKLESE
jgi:putative transposase